MANKIQIKRSVANSVVTGLSNGELAFTQASNTLYIGAPDGVSGSIPIGTALNYGTLTANSVLVANSSSAIDKIIVANAVITSISANGSSGTLGQILVSGGSGSNVYWLNSGALGVNTDAQFTWSNTQTFQNTITFDSVINGTANNANNLGGKSEGDLNVNSASSALTSNNSTYAFGKSEGDLNVNSASSALNANNANYLGGNTVSDILTLVQNNDNSFTGNNTFSGSNTVISSSNTNITGNLKTANADLSSIKLRGSSLISGSYDRNEINLNAGDQLQISGGNYGTVIRSANDGSSWFTWTFDPDTGAIVPSSNGTMNLGTTGKRFGTLYLAGSTIVLGNTTLSANGDALQVNNIVVTTDATLANIVGTTTNISSNLNITSSNVSMAYANLAVKDVTVSGNLTINGTLTTIDTNNLSVKDGVIKLADQNTTSDTIDFGFYGLSGNASATYYAGLYRDHSASTLSAPVFKLFASNVEPTTTVDNTATTYAIGTLNAFLNTGAFVANSSAVNITANSTVSSTLTANSLTLTSALAATSGGTGQNSYSAGDLLYASDSTTLSKLNVPASAANGQVLQIVNNLPAYGTLDGGSF